jgi:hypothetical protein
MLLAVPLEERYTTPWWGVGLGATLFWLVVGLIVGALGNHSSPQEALAINDPARPRSWFGRGLGALGRFLSRLLFGFFVGWVVSSIFAMMITPLIFTDLFDNLRGKLAGLAFGCGLFGSSVGGFAGALFAALFARNRSPRRLRIGKWVILGDLIGLLIGAYFAAAVGIIAAGVVGIDEFRKNKNLIYLPIGGGLVGGMLAGILAAACSTLSMRQSGRV